jgi:hypothetical protein
MQISDLVQALQNAHDAGDTEAASKLAAALADTPQFKYAAEKQQKQHEEATGFFPAVKSGFHEFVGNTEEALGFDKAAAEHHQKAAKAEATTEEDVARAKEKGVLPYLGAELRKNITEPLGGIVGRYGAPMVAAPIAAAAAPEFALAGIGAGALATGLTDLPAEVGGNIERQKQTGTGDVNLVNAIGAGIAQAAITAIGIPGTGAINKLVGPKLLAEAELLAPKVIEGTLTKEAAVKELSSRGAEYARAVASNAVGGAGMMIGTEELSRAQAGQELMTPEEMGQSAVQAGILAPIFGALHGSGRREAGALLTDAERRNRAVETIKKEREQRDADIERYRAEAKTQEEKDKAEEAVKKREDYHQTLEDSLSHLFPETKDKAEEKKADFKAALNEPSGVMHSDPITGHERELTMGEHFEQKYPELYPKQEAKAPTLDEATLTSLGLDMKKNGTKAMVGLDLSEHAQREQFNKILDKQKLTLPQKEAIDAFKVKLPEIPTIDAVQAKRMVLESDQDFTNPAQIRNFLVQKVGKENVDKLAIADTKLMKGILSEFKQNRPKQGTDRTGDGSAVLRGSKDAARAENVDTGTVDNGRDIVGRSDDGKAAQSAALEAARLKAEADAQAAAAAEQARLKAEADAKAAEVPVETKTEAPVVEKTLPAERNRIMDAAKKAANKLRVLDPYHDFIRMFKETPELVKKDDVLKVNRDIMEMEGSKTKDQKLKEKSPLTESEISKTLKEAETGSEVPSGGIEESRGMTGSGQTKETVMQRLVGEFGGGVHNLVRRGVLNVVNTAKDLPPHLLSRIDDKTKALHSEGKAYIISDRLKAADVRASLLHEVGEHYGLRGMLGKEVYNNLLGTLEKLKDSDAIVRDAWDKVSKAYEGLEAKNKDQFLREVMAHVGETAPNHGVFKRLLTAIKSFLVRNGIIKNLSGEELQDLVMHSLRSAMKRDIEQHGKGVEFSKKAEPNAALKALYEEAGGKGYIEKEKEPNLFQSTWHDPSEAMKKSGNWVQNFIKEKNTMWFSSDAAFMIDLEKNLRQNGLSFEEIRKLQLQLSTGQALHREALAHQVLDKGGLRYDPNTYKYVAYEKDGSWKGIIDAIKSAANDNGLSFEETEKYAHQAIVASRLRGLVEQKAMAKQRYEAELAVAKNAEAEKRAKEKFDMVNDKIIHLSEKQIAAGEQLFKKIPGLEKVVDQWNKVRQNVMDFAVESGLYTESDRDTLLSVMEWAPFYRVEQLENRAGPKEYSRGLLDLAKDKQFHGSTKEVNNVFDNMERWISYVIRKGVGNRSAADLTKAAMENFNSKESPEEVIKLEANQKVPTGLKGNVVGVWENGVVQRYLYKDPMYIHAFTGMEPVVIPALKGAAKFTDMLRQSIVLNPLFSVGQLSQDSFGAMFASGVKHPFAIPVEVMKEFVKTLRGTSTTHELLKDYGVVGHRDYSSIVSRIDAEVSAGLREPKLLDKLGKPFRFFSMASDNAVRQAIYNQTMKETGDKALAIERAFEIINFRRTGASSNVNFLRQTVPFFGAYLQAMNVSAKVIAGHGIAPAEKAEAQRVLYTTLAKVLVAGLIYNAMVSEDDGYKKLDPTVRDRKLIIPGTDGLSIPLRNDFFTFFSKIIPEHIYQMTMADATEDGTKAKKALYEGFMNALGSPNVVPQVIKPTLEVAVNHDFFTGRPIVGQGVEQLETSKQYSVNTSELAKAIGNTGLISPMNVDHLLKGYFGYTGGLALMATNHLISAGSDTALPDKSFQDLVASVPGMSAFVSREAGTRDKSDYYELRDQVSEAVSTYNFMKKHGTAEERKAYMEENRQVMSVKTQVNNINRQLSSMRNQERLIYETPDIRMSPEIKKEKIAAIRAREKLLLRNVEKLRLRAGL